MEELSPAAYPSGVEMGNMGLGKASCSLSFLQDPYEVNAMNRVCYILAISFLSVSVVQGQTPQAAMSIDPMSGTFFPTFVPRVTVGWSFSIVDSIDVTALGVFDYMDDDLAFPHTVGLWFNGGPLITSTTISPGAGTLNNGFRYVNIAPASLGPGDYVIRHMGVAV